MEETPADPAGPGRSLLTSHFPFGAAVTPVMIQPGAAVTAGQYPVEDPDELFA